MFIYFKLAKQLTATRAERSRSTGRCNEDQKSAQN